MNSVGMNASKTPLTKIRVAILDDHQSMLDSYTMRLTAKGTIEVVATANYGNELAALLKEHEIDVLILDIGVPNSEEDSNTYPILHMLSTLRTSHPHVHCLAISLHDEPMTVKTILDAGASGYVLKNDKESILHLDEVVTLINAGGLYLSEKLRPVVVTGAPFDGVQLSARQKEALSLAAANPDITTEELSKQLNIAASTLRNMLSKAYKRLGVRNRSAATEKARTLGLISPFPPSSPLDQL